jgi:hypothetical protein
MQGYSFSPYANRIRLGLPFNFIILPFSHTPILIKRACSLKGGDLFNAILLGLSLINLNS